MIVAKTPCQSGRAGHPAHLAAHCAQPIVFLTCTTHGRRQVLADERVHAELRGLWERSGEINGWYVGVYVLMPDHVHLFARQAPASDSLAKWMGMWKSVSARRIAKLMSIDPPVWQEDYFDRFLRSSENYSEKWAYVDANPVRAGLIADGAAWPYRGRITDLTV